MSHLALPETLLEQWQHQCTQAASFAVWPDGCQDLIGWQDPGSPAQWKLTALMDRAEWVQAPPGRRYRGFRLAPGVQVQAPSLLQAVARLELDDHPSVGQHLEAFTHCDPRVQEALAALATHATLPAARRALGVRERTLQRWVQQATGRTPLYWLALARLRRALRQLPQLDMPLADLAAAQGYTDQPHMNLEFRRWLGQTPGALRRQPAGIALASGHG
ncbi:helix-turn-helix domain-containing protein [Roseateles sp. BYS180W]|uniref:Helix-turn-helix domain-containing protein n=1 Tax=Roseateles rivi TaxID=3299028 RepID=A0ABW7FYS9_9BURK